MLERAELIQDLGSVEELCRFTPQLIPPVRIRDIIWPEQILEAAYNCT